MRIPFIGGAYAGISPNLDAQVCIGFYPEMDPKDDRSPRYAVPCPSLNTAGINFGSVNPIVGLHYVFSSTLGGRFYAVDSVGVVYKYLFQTSSLTTVGTLTGFGTNATPIQMIDNGATNGNQLLITNNSNGAWYINLATDSIHNVGLSGAWQNIGPAYIGYQDTYGIVVQYGSCVFWITNSFNFGTIGGNSFAQPQTITDQLNVAISDNIRLYLMGNTGMEVWYNAGQPVFPFARIPGAVYPIGCTSPLTAVKMDNSVIFLGVSEIGLLSVYQVRGIQPPQRISTTQVDYTLQKNSPVSIPPGTAHAYGYKDNGHEFYCLIIGSLCWCYDTTTGEWHQRTIFGKNNHVLVPLDEIFQKQGTHWFCSTSPGCLATFIPPTNDQTRQLISPHMNDQQKQLFASDLQINFNNLDTNVTPAGAMTLSWSKNDNNFQTTGNLTGGSTSFTVGSQPRFMMRRLGWARDWVFKLDCSSMTVPPIIMDCFVNLAYRTEGRPQAP